MTIGERIKARRIELNLSQDELARKCGYKSRSSINKIELSRDLPLKKIELMATALDVEPSYLMGWEDEEREKTNMDSVARLLHRYPSLFADTFLETYAQLSEDKRKQVRDYADFLIKKD